MYKFKLFREFNLYDLENNENLYDKLNQNKEKITDLERATFHFNKLKKGTIYE